MADRRNRESARRTLALLTLLVAAAVPARATRHLTVVQLEKTLAASTARHRADADLVREFGDFDLTERLTDSTRAHLCATLHLGPRATLALQLLADESALLDPPAAELPAMPPPDAATAERIFAAAAAYVTQTLPHLPDFLATRTTTSFDDTAQVFGVNEWPIRAGLHVVGKTSREITFRDDQEAPASAPRPVRVSAPIEAPAPPRGLQSYGEFGQLLGVIFIDTANSKPVFHHWERTAAGLAAVYRYAVPRSSSHYAVNYCCVADTLRTSTRQGGGRRGGAVNSSLQADATNLFHKVPAYHGSLFIDPATGVILRMTLEAEMGDSLVSRAATVIEYGTVTIGERRFVCPLRSMNLYEGPPQFGPSGLALPPSLLPTGTLYLNETSYTNYHRLGSSLRILTEAEAPPQQP